MGKPEQERLTEAIETCRAVTREANGAAKDLNRALAEQRAALRGEIADMIRAEVTSQLEVLRQATEGAVDQNVAAINARFDQLAHHLLDNMGISVEQAAAILSDPEYAAKLRRALGHDGT